MKEEHKNQAWAHILPEGYFGIVWVDFCTVVRGWYFL